jgi:hypothetical protein
LASLLLSVIVDEQDAGIHRCGVSMRTSMKTEIVGLACIAFALGCSSGGAKNSSSGAGGAASGSTSGSGGASGTNTTGSSSSGGGAGADVGSGAGGGSDCAGYVYCEDFEAYPAQTLANYTKLGPWSVTVGNAEVSVDTERPYRGSKSFHVVMAAGSTQGGGMLSHTPDAGIVPSNDLFGRMMIYYSSAGGSGLPLDTHSYVFTTSGTVTTLDAGTDLNMGGGGAAIQLNYQPPAGSGFPFEQALHGGLLTTDAWHCIQWQFDGSGAPPAHSANIWLDGSLVVELPPADGWVFATPWSLFGFGFTHLQTVPNGIDYYMDDFALSDAMIPCPK